MSLTKNISDLENYEIIRKLGKYESYYDYEVSNRNFYLTRSLLVNLTKGVIGKDLLKEACKYWAKRNPLLQAEIFRAENNRNEKYFVTIRNQEDFFNFNNVEIIETYDTLKWKEVMDQEIIAPFDLTKGPLWRLKVIKLINNDAENIGFNHVFILTSQHSIGDGRSMFTLSIQLLDIIGALIENRKCPEMDSIEQSLFSVEDFIKQKTFEINLSDEVKLDDENRIPDCFGDQVSGTHGKMEYFALESEKLSKLLKKTKENCKNAKLTGVLQTLIALALKNIYKKYECEYVESKQFQIVLLVSLREKLGLSNSYNGVFSAAFENSIQESLSLDSIWSIAEEKSILLHKRIKNNEDVKYFEHTDELWNLVENGEFSESNISFALSNIGVMKNTESDVIKVYEHYLRMPSIHKRIGSCMFNAISTINNRLCWAITYNEQTFTRAILLEIQEEMLNLIEKLIE